MLRSLIAATGVATGVATAAGGTISCVDAISTGSLFSGLCSDVWSELKPVMRPTQPQVGVAWIQRKLDKDFTSESEAQAVMDADPAPVVMGTDQKGQQFFFAVDDHHTLCGLDASGYDVTVTLNVLCDLRDYTWDAFWANMEAHYFSYLARHPIGKPNALPLPITPGQMPDHFSFTPRDNVFTDDPWRSLAGFSRKVQDAPYPAPACDTKAGDSKVCERCMYRGCGVDGLQPSGPSVDFFEFKWAYFFLYTLIKDASYWPDTASFDAFKAAYDALPVPAVIGEIDTSAWQEAANLLVPLCRAKATGNYQLPLSVFPTGGSLPGFVSGYSKLDDDPTCDGDVCDA